MHSKRRRGSYFSPFDPSEKEKSNVVCRYCQVTSRPRSLPPYKGAWSPKFNHAKGGGVLPFFSDQFSLLIFMRLRRDSWLPLLFFQPGDPRRDRGKNMLRSCPPPRTDTEFMFVTILYGDSTSFYLRPSRQVKYWSHLLLLLVAFLGGPYRSPIFRHYQKDY